MARLGIHKLGPVSDCAIHIKDFNIFTGPQSSGKSTVAKAVFFFKLVKNDLYAQLTSKVTEADYVSSLETDFKKRLRSRFLQTFGTSWAMPHDMHLQYTYDSGCYIEVRLEDVRNQIQKNYVNFEFSSDLKEFLDKYRNYADIPWDSERLKSLREEINQLFQDEFETVYIPAGRSMITLLTDQLLQISADETIHSLDYCTRSYLTTILPIRTKLAHGLEDYQHTLKTTTQKKIDEKLLSVLMKRIDDVLNAKYSFEGGEEKLILPNHRYVKINFASSGQQEAVWVLNMIYYYLLERKKIFLIVEEPETHLYPDSQKYMAEALGMFVTAGNQSIVTTHSPYLLGEFNNLLFAGDLQNKLQTPLKNELHQLMDSREYVDPQSTMAYYVRNGELKNAMEDGLIKNELIDHVSDVINEEMDHLLEIYWKQEEKPDA